MAFLNFNPHVKNGFILGMTHRKAFTALGNPRFQPLAVSTFLWTTGRWMENIVLIWLILEVTESAAHVAWLGTFRTAPLFLLGLLSGSITDRLQKRNVIVGAQVLSTLVTTGLLFTVASNVVQPLHAFLAVFLTGTASTLDFSARQAYLGDIFDESELRNAISLESVLRTAGRLLGPIIGGFLVINTGYLGAFGLIVILEICALLTLAFFLSPSIKLSENSAPSIRLHLKESLDLILINRRIVGTLLVTIIFNFFGIAIYQMVPLIARNQLNVDAAFYGILDSATGVGAVIGSVLLASLTINRQGIYYVCGTGLVMVSTFAFALSETYLLSFTLLLISGIGMSAFAILQITIILNAILPTMRGRAMGALAFCIGASPLGLACIAQVSEYLGAQFAIIIFGSMGFILLIVIALIFPELTQKGSMGQLSSEVNAPASQMRK